MAALIRMPGETDVEYQRRCRLLLELAASRLFRREVQKILDNRNVFEQHLRIADLRKSCRVEAGRGDTFTWDVWIPTSP
jgi:hypothetical protein